MMYTYYILLNGLPTLDINIFVASHIKYLSKCTMLYGKLLGI